MSKQVNLQKKISVAKCFGKVTAARVTKADGTLELGRIFGQATGTKNGVTDFGEWTALTGQFRAINRETGESFDSAVCFMPDVALELVTAQLAGGAKAVDFAFDISAVADESVQIGFTYRASPVLPMAEDSAVARLESQMKALAAPKAEAPTKSAKK